MTTSGPGQVQSLNRLFLSPQSRELQTDTYGFRCLKRYAWQFLVVFCWPCRRYEKHLLRSPNELIWQGLNAYKNNLFRLWDCSGPVVITQQVVHNLIVWQIDLPRTALYKKWMTRYPVEFIKFQVILKRQVKRVPFYNKFLITLTFREGNFVRQPWRQEIWPSAPLFTEHYATAYSTYFQKMWDDLLSFTCLRNEIIYTTFHEEGWGQ